MCGFLTYLGEDYSQEFLVSQGFEIGHRGPDSHESLFDEKAFLGFHRLSIMDTSDAGMQPFQLEGWTLVCNGEIYNYQALKAKTKDYHYRSGSDCEVLLPLLVKYGLEMCRWLDAEFAFSAYHAESGRMIAARDPIGIRPLFYGYRDAGIAFASEAKALIGFCEEVFPFPPGHYYDGEKFVEYTDLLTVETIVTDMDEALVGIHDKLIEGIRKRLMSDVEVGFLLSGGLDSSLVCAVAAKMSTRPIHTFAIGMESDAIDLKYARLVADKIGSIHHEVMMSSEEVINALPEVIKTLETYDITTIRASMGMYLLCQYIHRETSIKVLLTGEISDELFGYKYTDFAPSAEAFQEESLKRVQELYMYDVLRADRCVSAWSLEARVPFGDLDFVKHVLSIDPNLKMNHYDCGKYLLRKAFEAEDLLPPEILWREKAAFSDAVGHSMVDDLKAYAQKQTLDFDHNEAIEKYPFCSPISSESLVYREIFNQFYPTGSTWIKGYWMPNKTWPGCDVDDPSARVLSNYGMSGE